MAKPKVLETTFLNAGTAEIKCAQADMRLEPEFEYFLKHQDELVERYGGKVIVIKGQTVLGAYDSVPEAVHETSRTHELGTFLVQKCEPGVEAYTQTFHSRVGVTH